MIANFNTANLFAGVIFSGSGFGAFIYGKKTGSFRPMLIGIALMAYPYFLSNTLLMYLIGVVLTAALYFWRE